MRVRRIWIICLGAIALVVPAAATAAPHRFHREIQQPLSSGLAYLGEAGGYQIALANPSSHVAILYVDRFGHGEDAEGVSFAQTAYAVRPQRSIASGSFRASFGSMGMVNLRFYPSGRTKVGHTSKHCRGRSPQTEFGTYRGTVTLRGEDGYFELHVHRARGSRSRSFRLSCTRGQAYKDEPEPLYEYVEPSLGFTVTSAGGSIALILAVSRQGGRFAYLRAAHMEGASPGAEIQAATLEREHGMAIGRAAFTSGGEGTLLTSLPGVHPATATLAPPAPFQGEGDFIENSPTSHSWTGTLAVDFPGLSLPLTGPGYATSLCVSSPLKTRVPCDFQRQPRFPE